MQKIAVICAENSRDNVTQILTENKKCISNIFLYKDLQNVQSIFAQCKDEYDGFLFSGWLPYSIITGTFGVQKKPCAYFKLSEGDFYRTIWKIAIEHPGQDYKRVMIDDPQIDLDMTAIFGKGNECLITSFNSLEDAMQTASVMDNNSSKENSALKIYKAAMDAYKTAYNTGRIDIIVTRLSNLIPLLEKEKIKYYVLSPSIATMKETFDHLINTVTSGHYVDMLSVNGLLSLENSKRNPSKYKDTEYINKLISIFNRQNGTTLFVKADDDKFALTTSYKIFQNITNNENCCKLSLFLKEKLDCGFFIGWGLGYDIFMARDNAKKAWKISRHGNKCDSYIVNEDGIITGPLSSKEKLTFQGLISEQIIDMSNRFDVSRMNINRVQTFLKQKNTNITTSEELSIGLGISERTARRILQKLRQNGAAKLIGTDDTGLKGRPSCRYFINLK